MMNEKENIMNPMHSASISDIKQYLANTGYVMPDNVFDFAYDNDAFKYIGYDNKYHRFLVAFEDEEQDENYYVSSVFVSLGANGLICADFGGMPEFESEDADQVIEYIKNNPTM